MKNILLIFIFAVSFIFTSCSTSYEITKKIIANEGKIITQSSPVIFMGNSTNSGQRLSITFKHALSPKEDKYTFIIHYKGTNYLLINGLNLKTGIIKKDIYPDRYPLRKRDGLLGITEEMYLDIDKEIIDEILNTGFCEMKLISDNIIDRFYWSDEMLAKFEQFYYKTKQN